MTFEEEAKEILSCLTDDVEQVKKALINSILEFSQSPGINQNDVNNLLLILIDEL